MDSQSTKEIVSAIGISAVVIIAILSGYWWRRRRQRLILQKWADENGLKILRSEERFLFGAGPFKWWSTVAKQPVYHITVRERDGHERSGWIRLECKWGMLEEGDRKTEVKWEVAQ
jgi:hypothetical protein